MRYIIVAFLLITLVVVLWISTAADDENSPELRGQALLASNCSRCHAIGRSGNSNHPEAPPFRILSQRYVIDNLAEALAEGLSTGHPDMPEFVFEAEDVGAILAYLKSIQVPGDTRTRNR